MTFSQLFTYFNLIQCLTNLSLALSLPDLPTTASPLTAPNTLQPIVQGLEQTQKEIENGDYMKGYKNHNRK